MYYHVRISLKSQKTHDETKNDLSEEQLISRIIAPYELGEDIIINGKTIEPKDIERIKVNKSNESSDMIKAKIKLDDSKSTVISIGGPSYSWRAAARAEDVTDEYIKGKVGFKKSAATISAVNENSQVANNKVFIVHGHDNELKNDIYIFLKEIGLDPIVLHRQTDEGLTIVEKFEKFSDVGYAFILLTPDDVGTTVKQYNEPNSSKDLEFRARQNVIFEFGYFVAKLGRKNVCCVYKEGVTLPSDISGLLYKKIVDTITPISYEIIKELKVAGIPVKIE